MPRTERDIIIQSLGIATDAHAHDVATWTRSRNPALESAITEARQMQIECEELRDRLIGQPALPDFTVHRFSVGSEAILARPPQDPLRAEAILPFIGRTVTIRAVRDELYAVLIAKGVEFYVSPDMLDSIKGDKPCG